jgi:nitroreductase
MTKAPLPNEAQSHRKADHPINPIFLMRWSPRSMSGEKVSDEDLLSLFEAAKWAPSSYNNQPWRFIYAKKGDENWEGYLGLLVPANQLWAKKAGALVILISNTQFENGKPNPTHSLDSGSAWMSMALEATFRRLAIHGMSGYDGDKAREIAEIPEGYNIEMMIAIGHRAPKEFLPENLASMETPNGRKQINELVFSGKMGHKKS